MKLLVVKTSSMGDVIHTLPAVTDALAALPGLDIGWAVERPFAPVVRLHPGVRRVHAVELRRWRASPFAAEARAARAAWKAELRAASYDRVIDAQGLMKSAWLARKAGAPIDGLSFSSIREWPAALLYSRRHAIPRDLHAVTRVRRLFGAALGYAPDPGAADFGIAPPRRAERGSAAFLLHGTSWETKEWPLASWIALARGLAGRGLTPVATWSDERERTTAEAIAAGAPLTILPKSGLDEIAGALGRARLAVGVDTGLTHLAAAFGVPTVALYVASRPGLTGPLGDHATALVADGLPETGFASRRAAPADAASITPEKVLAAAEALLGRWTVTATGP